MELKEYVALINAIADGNKAISDLKLAEGEKEAMKREIDRKEKVIVKVIGERNTLADIRTQLEAQIVDKDKQIALQQNSIKRLSRPKRFAIGPSFGYGLMFPKVTGGFTAGVTLTYGLIRF